MSDMADELVKHPAAAAARAAFADELGVPVTSVRVLKVEEVTWRDSSLGCPQPGQAYLQVLTPGYRISLEANGRVAVYHTDRGSEGRPRQVIRCAKGAPTDPLAPVSVPDVSALAATALDRARADLETRLPDQLITLEDTRLAEVTTLSCDEGTAEPGRPAAGDRPAKVIFELRLRAGSEVHLYRSWNDQIVYCGVVEERAEEVE